MKPDQTRAASVALENVTKAYGAVVAIRNLSLEAPQGKFVSLLGPSGCGKTTCLRLIAGFETPTAGKVIVQGADVTDVPPYKRGLGMVFQNYALFPHLTVAQNVEFGLKMRRTPRRERKSEVDRALALVKLTGFADRYPTQLSGGQQQRVALARAIVFGPSVLLLDESLSALDKGLREQMQTELRNLQRDLGLTAIFVTHDQEEAMTMSDLVVVMNRGRIEQAGSPSDIYERPDTEFVARFLGASNIIDARVVSADASGARLDVLGRDVAVGPSHSIDGVSLKVSLRPERIALSPAGADADAYEVADVVYRGPHRQVTISRPNGPTLTVVSGNTGLGEVFERGAKVKPTFDEASVVVLRPDLAEADRS